jgi:putative DNA primase/helicase
VFSLNRFPGAIVPPFSVKDQVLGRLNFEAFYRGELENLKATAGDNYITVCPFHADTNPSLSVNFTTGLFKCFGCDAQGDVFAFYMNRHGCDFKEALAALGQQAGVDMEAGGEARPKHLSLRLKEFALAKRLPEDFLAANGVQEFKFPDGIFATDFHYRDEQGKVTAIRHRFANTGDKKFRWRKGDKVQLYGLWKMEKIQAAGWLLLVEGETDSLTCWRHGIPALGLPGKKTWKRCRTALGENIKLLQDLEVYLWQEPDAVDLPAEVALDLPAVKVIKAPQEFKDLSEAHCQGKDIKALVEEFKSLAKPPEPPPWTPAATGFSLSDLGNARRLVALHGKDFFYCQLNKKWYCWNGRVWAVDSTAQVERWAKDVPADLYREAADCRDFKEREARGKFALKCEDSRRILAMVRLAQSEPGVPVLPSAFDAQPWLLNCANGTIDLRTGQLRPHCRDDLLTCMAPVNYMPDASCDLWERFLYQIQDVSRQPASADRMVMFLQRAIGYALTGSTQEQCLFVMWGGGANGKSTLLNLVKEVLGSYAMHTPTETLLAKNRGGDIPTDVARLDGPRLVTASEVDRGRRLAESLVKELTGQDTVSARFLYGEYFDFKPQFKLFLSTNNKPVIRGADNAIWRRIKMIPFNVQFGEGMDLPRDDGLADKLRAEYEGILAWMVRGCLYWQEEGLAPPAEVTEAIAAYRAEMDVLAEFMEDCCLVGPGLTVTAGDIYSAYLTWAGEAGLRDKEQMKQRTFGICLTERGFKKNKGAGGKRMWRGVGLRSID